ncbi:MAG TPA: hypothetical protein VFQ84_10430 [Arenimonas sp.]|uniref:hypothetical protein n=1 Tax=Arenimonas sp. TaxID=1872635 RepID=UPI002D805F0F|nr:hypothetical protein [Arenimonas sp.]HEU0153746.1 hypothetical protein [Arenimonas sp.]
MFLMMGLMYFVVDLAAILLLSACWQRTRIRGFAIVAASYGAGIVARWTAPLAYRWADSGDGGMGSLAGVVVQTAFFLVAVVAVVGFWDIYRVLKQRPAA